MAPAVFFVWLLASSRHIARADTSATCDLSAPAVPEMEVETVEESMAMDMQFQLLQSSTSIGANERPEEQDSLEEAPELILSETGAADDQTPRQIREQARERRMKLIHDQAQALREKKTLSQKRLAQEHVAELTGHMPELDLGVDTSTIAGQAAQLAAQVKKQMVLNANGQLEDLPDAKAMTLNSEGRSSQEALAEGARSDDELYVYHDTPRRQMQVQMNLQAQLQARNRAVKHRSFTKKHAALANPIGQLASEAKQAERAARALQAVKDEAAKAALNASVEMLKDQGVNAEELKAAERLLGVPATSLLGTSTNKADSDHPRGPGNARALEAKEMLKMQHDRREQAKRIRMAKSGASQAHEARKKAKEEQEKEEEEKESEATRLADHLSPEERRVQERSKAMHERLEQQATKRKAVALERQQQFMESHHQEVHSKEGVDVAAVEPALIKQAPLDAKLSPEARRNQLHRLMEAQQHEMKLAIQRSKREAAESKAEDNTDQ